MDDAVPRLATATPIVAAWPPSRERALAMTLPLATLDHVVVNVQHRMEEAAELYRRLGFTLTPRGHHTLGSINHLAVFGTDYLELIGAPPDGARSDLLGWPTGLNGLVWGTEDADAVHAALTTAEVASSPPLSFSRPVEFASGARDAAFRTVRLPNDTTPAGRLYFCEHATRHLVWRDEWRRHANGTIGVLRAVIAADDPARLAGLFLRMFGPEAVAEIDGGHRLAVGLTSFDIVNPAELTRRLGAAAPGAQGRSEYMAALVLRTTSLDQAEAVLANGDIPCSREPHRLVVAPAHTFGVALVFHS
jgi:hypothetical protein